jgi:glyceraldehyde-3-phosphate dehydrogenase type I
MKAIAVNGFGRIGRNFVRAVLQDKEAHKKINITAINIGPEKLEFVAHLFQYDTLMGTYPGKVLQKNDYLLIDDHVIHLLAQPDPCNIDWKQFNIDWVVECTGHFTTRQGAEKHLKAGAKKVLISAPAHDEDITIVPGVNDNQFDKNKHHIISLGSCTTNAFIPLAKLMHDAFAIQTGFMKTVHAYTNSQVLLDVQAKDLRSSRAAALNIIPTSTGSATMLAKLLPDLDKKIACSALRVPVGKVSLIDFSFVAHKPISVEKIHNIITTASHKKMLGIVDLTFAPLVSSDFNGNSFSVVVDGSLTQVIGTSANLFGWYDNEWGYSERLKSFLLHVR